MTDPITLPLTPAQTKHIALLAEEKRQYELAASITQQKLDAVANALLRGRVDPEEHPGWSLSVQGQALVFAPPPDIGG